MNWFKKHLNWTISLCFFCYSLAVIKIIALNSEHLSIRDLIDGLGFLLPLLAVFNAIPFILISIQNIQYISYLLLPAIIFSLVCGWVLKRKNRNLALLILTAMIPLGWVIPLCLKNLSSELTNLEKAKEPPSKNIVQSVKKKCPHCGELLDNARFKCVRCKEWVPNELFNKLCDKDVECIKRNNLNPYPPYLAAIAVIGFLQDGDFERKIQKILKRNLNGREKLNVLIFHSFCYFNAIHVNTHMKSGLGSNNLPARQIIEKQLEVALLNGVIKLIPKMVSELDYLVSEVDYENSLDIERLHARALYNMFRVINSELIADDEASQIKATLALAALIYSDKQANIYIGLQLYTKLRETSMDFLEVFEKMFLIEEEDFDWRSAIHPK